MEDSTINAVSTPASTSAFAFPNVFTLIKEAAVFAYKNFVQLAGLVLVPVIFIACIEAALVLFARSSIGADSLSLTAFSQPLTAIIFLVLGFLFLLIECVFVGSVIIFVTKKDSGKDINIIGAWKAGLSYSWPLFCALFILQLSGTALMMLFIIPGLVLVYYGIFFPFTTLVDGYKNVDSLIASFVLVRGAWWRTIGYYIVLGVMFGVLEIVFLITSFILGIIFGFIGAILHLVSFVVGICVAILFAFVFVAFITFAVSMAVHYIYGLYKSLKLRKVNVFEAEFASVRPKAQKFFLITAIIGFVVVVAFYSSGLYDKYVSFIQRIQTEQLQHRSQVIDNTYSDYDQMQ